MITLHEAIESFMGSMTGVKSQATIRWYATRLRSLEKSMGPTRAIEAVELDGLRAWRAELTNRSQRWINHPYRKTQEGGLSPYTIHSYIRVARIFFAWLIEEGQLKRNPAERLEFPKLPQEPCKGIPEADMRAIVQEAKSNARDHALLLFLADTCCRVGGLVNLRISDLNLDERRAIVHEKGQEARQVYFSKDAHAALQAWLSERPAADNDYVFVSTRRRKTIGEQLLPSAVNQLIGRLAKNAGISGRIGPHQWRHAGARNLILNGAPLSVVAQILGHADIGVTWRFYSGLGSPQLQQAHERYGYAWEVTREQERM